MNMFSSAGRPFITFIIYTCTETNKTIKDLVLEFTRAKEVTQLSLQESLSDRTLK